MSHRVFVVELDESFGAPLRPDRPNVYVGTAAGALADHVAELVAGTTGPPELRGHVVRDRPDLYERYGPTTRRHARSQARRRACRLIRRSHFVYGRRRWRVYVVELERSQLKADGYRGWVYVGQSSKAPEERFAEHRRGARNARGRLYNTKVRDHGVRLLPRYFERISPACSEEEAKEKERDLAVRLQEKGYKVEGDGLPVQPRRLGA